MHPSAQSPEAAQALLSKTLQKVSAGYTQIIPWSKLKLNIPAQLKISPITTVLHKTRAFWMILDLSFATKATLTMSPPVLVNTATNQTGTLLHLMKELGWVLPRIIYTLAHAPAGPPLLFVKLDIKDGFWRMIVPPDAEFNFIYVLPTAPDGDSNDIQIVVPSSLQMGWTSSPPYFCAATETGCDIAQDYLQQPVGTLPLHYLEHHMLAGPDVAALSQWVSTPPSWHNWDLLLHFGNLQMLLLTQGGALHTLLEVYVDNFIGVSKALSLQELCHATWAILYGIHTLFSLPMTLTSPDNNPISFQKLVSGDSIWRLQKEILGWIFNGVH